MREKYLDVLTRRVILGRDGGVSRGRRNENETETQEGSMDDQTKAQELLGHLAGKAVKTMTVWADANQRVLRELVEFSTATAKEGVRLYAELQQGAIEVLRDSQAAAGRWQASWSGSAKDPVHAYQKALMEGVESVEKAFKLLEGHAQA